MADYLVYWPWDIAHYERKYIRQLVHDASDQFQHRHIQPGDVLWYVTMPVNDEGRLTGHLCLFGRLEVGDLVFSNADAQRRLQEQFKLDYKVRSDAHLHIFARPGTQSMYTLIPIDALAPALRFESTSGRDRLTISEGLVANTFEMRAMRRLTQVSAYLLNSIWETRPIHPVEPTGLETQLEPDGQSFPEGAAKLRTHLVHERNRDLVSQAKQHFKATHGRLFCQACGFDFRAVYGEIGEDYIEAHHTVPISELTESSRTRIEDLAMVCANCHRMLHRRRLWLGMDQLHQLINTAR